MNTKPLAMFMALLMVLSLSPAILAESGDGSDGADDDESDDNSGNDRQVRRGGDDDSRWRAARVTDEEGNTRVIRQGQQLNDDGTVTTKTSGRARDADGNVVGKDRVVKRDAEGNVIGARGRHGRYDAETGEVQKRAWAARSGSDDPNFRDRLRKARDNYQGVRDRYENARDKHRENRDRLSSARETLAECDDDTDECQALRDEYRGHASDYLLSAAEALLKQIERIRGFIEGHVEDEEKQAEMLAELDEVEGQVQDVIAKIEGLGDDATAEELRAAAKELKEVWQKVKKWSKNIAHRIKHHRVLQAAHKLENLEEKFYKVADRLAEAGADTSLLDELVDEFAGKLDELADAREDDETDAKAVFKEAVALVKGIAQEIRDLRQLVGDNSGPGSANSGNFDDEDDDEDDLDDDEDEEDDEEDDLDEDEDEDDEQNS